VRQPERIIPKVQVNQPVESTIEVPEKEETKESGSAKGLFSRLFNRKSEVEQEETPIETKDQTQKSEQEKAAVETSQPEPIRTERYVKRKVSTLKSIDHIFRKVEGLNARCNQVVSTDNGLLVATTAGLFSVKDNRASAITDNRFINCIAYNSIKGRYYVGGDDGIMEVSFEKEGWKAETGMYGINEPVYSIAIENADIIWASGNNIVFSFEKGAQGESISTRTYTFQSDFPERARVSFVNDTLMLLTETGISYFSYDEGLLIPYLGENNITTVGTNSKFLISSSGTPWINSGNGWSSLVRDIDGLERLETFLKIFDNIISIRSDDEGSYWITDGESGIFRITGFARSDFDPVFNIFINNVTASGEQFFDLTNLVFEPLNNQILINISAPHFIKETSTQYQWFIDELSKEWSPWSNNPDIFLNQEPGSYTIRIRARNILGNISQEKIFSFTIKPPFTQTVWFYILISIGALGLFIGFIYVRESKLRHDKKVLEEKVVERTLEIELKKQQIEVQRDEIFKQKEEITSSITYASRIQDAILPGQKQFRNIFKEFFIIFKPRDIVSGDFYWIDESDSRVSFAVADCTGHGVPGAIMSMLGISLLNEITANASEKISASGVLSLLREKVIFSLNQSGRDDEANDGMDIAYCILDKKRNRLEFAGAFNPLYLIRKGELTEYKADRMPIGYHIKQAQFTNHEIELKKGDTIYIFSDGYYDQFGGPKDKRFSSGRLKKMLKEVSSLPMEEQKEIIEARYQDWKRETEQVDDIIFLGVRI
jgi:serine phosphatase RsbU (regulator of sigma subunit)